MIKSFKFSSFFYLFTLISLVFLLSGTSYGIDFDRLINSKAAGFIYIDFQPGSKIGMLDIVLRSQENDEYYSDLKLKTGIDVEQDIKYVVMVFIEEDESLEIDYVLAGCSIDEDKLSGYLRKISNEEIHSESFENRSIYRINVGRKYDDIIYFAYLEPDLLAFGPDANNVKKAIKVYSLKDEGLKANQAISPLMKHYDDRHLAWAAISIPVKESTFSEEDPASILQNLRSIAVGARYESDPEAIYGDLYLYMSANEYHPKMVEFLNRIKAEADMQLDQESEIIGILKSAVFEDAGDHLKVSFKLDKEFLDKVRNAEDEDIDW